MNTLFPFKIRRRPVGRCGLAAVLAVLLMLPFSPSASADGEGFSLGECSDAVLRVETRLSDLGYLTNVVNGLWEQADADALDRFTLANDVNVENAVDALFSQSALSSVQADPSVFQSGGAGFVLAYGSLMPWSEVKTRLVVGETYTLTGCYSGIQLHMTCLSTGNYARMQPALDWDNATLRGFFSSASSSEKQPVVVAIDGILVAASIQCAPAADGTETPVYSVYFHNSVSEISGIPDAEHEAVVLVASGG